MLWAGACSIIMVSDSIVILLLMVIVALTGALLYLFIEMKLGAPNIQVRQGEVRRRTPSVAATNELNDIDDDNLSDLVTIYITTYGHSAHRKNNCGGAKNPKTCYASRELLPFVNFAKCCKVD